MTDKFDLRRAYDLSGRVALVTGASRGIGRAIAIALGDCGATVAVHYVGATEQAQEVADRIGHGSVIVRADLKEAQAAQGIVESVTGRLGPVDILVLNASVQFRRSCYEVNRGEFDEQINVNFRSSFELIQLISPAMIERKWGRILTVGSVQQQRPHSEMLPYGASKAALEHVARNFAKQLAPHGVTINNLAPGVIETDRNAKILADPDAHDRIEKWIPMRRIGRTHDCVGAALLLCSHAGAYITGVDLHVAGGAQLP
ncbi:SDR family NAD(P)-dependent oxidoreductase [Phycisphaerales bacterium AB-hyl4]|uniref:SDR family NAD(P)-dependent oxidoreductase n=1 Tax=Natronomicrosphaera hydrolytica TaxID=3242702 RepID=A0ABV4U2A0_9BACT